MSQEVPIPQPPEKSKAEIFAENPERFEDLKNCLLVVKRDPETKRLVILNQAESIEDCFVIEGYVRDAMMAFRNAVRARAAAVGIAKPNGKGIMNFARNGFRK